MGGIRKGREGERKVEMKEKKKRGRGKGERKKEEGRLFPE